MLLKRLVPEIGCVQDRRIRARITTKAMRLSGVTWWRGFLTGVTAFIPAAILADSYYFWRFGPFNRAQMFMILFVMLCVCMQLSWMLLVSGSVRRNVRRLLRQYGLFFCYDCGYDLTGNVSGNCPECGLSASLPHVDDQDDSGELT